MIDCSQVNYKWVMIGIGLLLGIFLFVWKSKTTSVRDLYKLMGIGGGKQLPQTSEATPELEEPTILSNTTVTKEPFAVRADRPKENEDDKEEDIDEFV